MTQNANTTVEVIEIPASYADFATAAGLPHDAAKGDIVAKMGLDRIEFRSAQTDLDSVFAATGAKTVDEVLGAVAAWKVSSTQLAEANKKADGLERVQLIGDAKAAKKLTPHQETALEGKPLEFVRSFLEILAPIPALAAEEPVEPKDGKSVPSAYSGKSWDEMTFAEKHALHGENLELYTALRDAAKK